MVDNLSLVEKKVSNEIIKRCQSGDVSAFKEIYKHFEQPLLRIALRMLGQIQDAEDAVQTTFIKLYHGIKNYKYSAKFSTYLYRILMNVCYDLLGKRKKMSLQDLETVNPSYKTDNDLAIQLESAILELPEKMRACFVLFAVEEFKQTEIAEILKLSVGGVKSNIFHAKKKLREMLSKDLKGYVS
jgi:RNA polymerase sigma factor (sigma-70 family)